MSEAAGDVKVIFSADTSAWGPQLTKANAQVKQLGQQVSQTAAETRRQMAEAKGSIAVLGEEIGVRLPRHVRNFVATLPGVAGAMSAAFNAVAVFAIADAVFQAGEKIVEFVRKNEEAARKNAEAWRNVQEPMRLTNDQLALANDKLESAIAKIEGKPENRMKEAIDEAIVSADQLGEKLDADLTKIGGALKGQEPAWYEFMQRGTGDVTDRSKGLQGRLDDLDLGGHAHLDALRARGASDAEIQGAQQTLDIAKKATIDAELRWTEGQLEIATALQKSGRGMAAAENEAPRIGVLTSYGAGLGRMSDFMGLTETHDTLEGQLGQDQKKKDAEIAAREAATKRMQAASDQLEALKAQHSMTHDEEAAFWQKLADAAGRGSLVYTAALKHANEQRVASLVEFQQQMVRSFVGQSTDSAREKNESDRITDSVTSTWEAEANRDQAAQKKMEEAAVEAFRLAEQSQRAAEKIEEERIKLEVAMGRLSRLQGAQQLQALHQQNFAEWQGASASFSAAFPDTPLPGGAQAMRDQGVQSVQDDAATHAATALGGLEDAAGKLAQQFTDTSAIAGQLLVQTLTDFNETLIKVMTSAPGAGDSRIFKQLGTSIFSSVAKSGLQYLEGSAMKLFLGHDPKAKLGTRGNPMYTIDAASPGGSGLPAAGGGLLGWLNDSDWAGKLFGGKLFGSGGIFETGGSTAGGGSGSSGVGGLLGAAGGLASAVGGLFSGGSSGFGDSGAGWGGQAFAYGGPTSANMPIMVGEQGPEIFTPSTSGRVIPNGGGGSSPTIHIDARGSTDPAATQAAVNRAMAGYLPYMGDMAKGAVSDHARRSPARRR